ENVATKTRRDIVPVGHRQPDETVTRSDARYEGMIRGGGMRPTSRAFGRRRLLPTTVRATSRLGSSRVTRGSRRSNAQRESPFHPILIRRALHRKPYPHPDNAVSDDAVQ